jgi:flagellar hook assembly protein FlgD
VATAWRLDWGNTLTVPGAPADASLTLAPCFPNPTSARTRLRFTLDQARSVTLAIFDVGGRRVRTLEQRPLPAGTHDVLWDGRTEAGSIAPSGIYSCVLWSEGARVTRRLVITR